MQPVGYFSPVVSENFERLRQVEGYFPRQNIKNILEDGNRFHRYVSVMVLSFLKEHVREFEFARAPYRPEKTSCSGLRFAEKNVSAVCRGPSKDHALSIRKIRKYFFKGRS